MQKKTFQTLLFLSIFFFGGALTQERVQGAEEYQASLNCGFSEVTADTDVPLMLEKGAAPTIACEVTSATQEKALSVFVLGKQSVAGVSVASSGTNIAVEAGGTTSATLSFPAVFQNGEYDYVITAVDVETGQLLTNEVVLRAIIGGEAELTQLEKTIFGKEQYRWGDTAELTVFLKTSENLVITPDMFSLRIVMVTKEDEECAVLVDKTAVTGAAMKLSFNFPREGQCSNALRVSLRDAKDTVIDQKLVAVTLSQGDTVSPNILSFGQGLFASMPKVFWIFLALTSILVLALVGYVAMRKRKF